jgi:hypothetical protein
MLEVVEEVLKVLQVLVVLVVLEEEVLVLKTLTPVTMDLLILAAEAVEQGT